MKGFKIISIIFLFLFFLLYAFYLVPKKIDEDILYKISSSLENRYYDEVCGIYLGVYDKYENAARGNSTFFDIVKNDKKYTFLARHIALESFFYTAKSEKRFRKIGFLDKGETVCVIFSTKYLEADKSYNYRQVPLLISIH